MPGVYDASITPWVIGMHDALDDRKVTKIVAMKSAQVAWTDGVLLNYVGRRVHQDPCSMIVMFPKAEAAKTFNKTKLLPMVEATGELRRLIDIDSRNSPNSTAFYKEYPGGYLRLVGSNAAANVKSDPVPVVCVEEPDDCNTNIDGQGDSITLLEERTKTFAYRKVILGGTPTIDGISRVQSEFALSDQRRFWVPCPHCGEFQTLEWENVHWDEDPNQRHEVFGQAVPSSARYVCPHCGGVWKDAEKNKAVKKGQWRASAPFNGVAGFYINEIYSPFPGSTLEQMTIKFLNAQRHMEMGDDSVMRSFFNNQLGKPYRYTSDMPSAEELASRVEDYPEMVVPLGACVVTAGVDVQHDRVAVVIRAWGRGEESWLLWWGEIFGQVIVPEQGVWKDLDALLSKEIQTAAGRPVKIRAVSIDSSDGQTSDAVYSFVRRRMASNVMAIKGSSLDKTEIFNTPMVSVDKDRKQKAHRYGLRPFSVGVSRAKDLLLGTDASGGRIRLTGDGPGRMHWYAGVRPDYFEQITSEIKAPSSTRRGQKVWTKLSGVRNEALDCEVYALHAARSLKINLWKTARWQAEEDAISKEVFQQIDLLAEKKQEQPAETAVPEPRKPLQQPIRPRRFGGGFSATRW